VAVQMALFTNNVLYRLVLFPVTLSDPNYPKPPNFRHFVSPFISSYVERYFEQA